MQRCSLQCAPIHTSSSPSFTYLLVQRFFRPARSRSVERIHIEQPHVHFGQRRLVRPVAARRTRLAVVLDRRRLGLMGAVSVCHARLGQRFRARNETVGDRQHDLRCARIMWRFRKGGKQLMSEYAMVQFFQPFLS